MKSISSKFFLHIVLMGAMLMQGCSTEKNSGITRTYHNITTRYNVLFNARESYKSGIRRAEQSIRYDYMQMLPLFLYGDDGVFIATAGDMETAAMKATKAINFHSIKAKPKVGKTGMSPAQKKFYNKREFNKHIDKCYLIIGKSYVYTKEYFLAIQTFNFMETEFPEEKSIYEARVWRAKALILDRDLLEAGRLLTDLLDDPKFPNDKSLRSELYATVADWHIKYDRHAYAINYLNHAIEHTVHKKTLMRYRYVLAQLYMEQGDLAQASQVFRSVIRMNPPYEMAFNATISLATASKGGDVADVKKQLNKMLRDSKNLEYHDQIYFSLAEIELHDGNFEKAIEYFQMSAQSSTMNLPQKTRSYLTLGNIFYDRREYLPAQAYYDSAMLNMQSTYPRYIQILSRAQNLDALVHNLKTVHFQDSVQRIARMSETERNRLINDVIAALKLKEQREKEAEAIRQQQYYSNMSRRSSLPDASSRSQWYFYNPSMVTQGINEFESRWGRRNLEDNWRRMNKGTAEMAMTVDDSDEEEQDAGAGRVQDLYTPEYYLQDVPLTDSMMTVSHRMIEESLYAAGYIYNNNFEEYALSAAQYEDLIRRYPQSDYVIPSYYYLYQLYSKLGKTVEAEKNKNLLLTRSPESVYAKIMLDPDYLIKLAQQTSETEHLYQQVYNQFHRDEFYSVIVLATEALERYPNDALAPQFAYLKALSAGRLGTNETMRAEMIRLTNEYSGTEIAIAARNLIEFIDGVEPELKQAEQAERAKTLYTYNEKDEHYFVWMLDSKESINQLWYDIQIFYTDHFINYRLFIDRFDFDARNIFLMVKGFSDFQLAQEFYRKFLIESEYHKNLKYEYSVFMISGVNFTIMRGDGNIGDYIEFFKNEYE